jgi:hypothetical protein
MPAIDLGVDFSNRCRIKGSDGSVLVDFSKVKVDVNLFPSVSVFSPSPLAGPPFQLRLG